MVLLRNSVDFVFTFVATQLTAAIAGSVLVAAISPAIVGALIGALGQLSAALLTWYLITRSRKNGNGK